MVLIQHRRRLPLSPSHNRLLLHRAPNCWVLISDGGARDGSRLEDHSEMDHSGHDHGMASAEFR